MYDRHWAVLLGSLMNVALHDPSQLNTVLEYHIDPKGGNSNIPFSAVPTEIHSPRFVANELRNKSLSCIGVKQAGLRIHLCASTSQLGASD